MSTAAISSACREPLAQDFEELFREQRHFVYRTAYSITGSPHDAEDVLQTIFVRLLQREVPREIGKSLTAAKQHSGHLYVQTKDVTVSVAGTVFLVNAEETGSRVAVIQGEVQVQQGATSRKLSAGEQVATNPAMIAAPVKKEIKWSKDEESQLALLERQTAESQRSSTPPRLEFAAIEAQGSVGR